MTTFTSKQGVNTVPEPIKTVLIRANREDDQQYGSWHIVNPDTGLPILSSTSDYVEFRTKADAIKYVVARGYTPVDD